MQRDIRYQIIHHSVLNNDERLERSHICIRTEEQAHTFTGFPCYGRLLICKKRISGSSGTIGRIMVPQNVHVLIAGPWDCVTLHSKGTVHV